MLPSRWTSNAGCDDVEEFNKADCRTKYGKMADKTESLLLIGPSIDIAGGDKQQTRAVLHLAFICELHEIHVRRGRLVPNATSMHRRFSVGRDGKEHTKEARGGAVHPSQNNKTVATRRTMEWKLVGRTSRQRIGTKCTGRRANFTALGNARVEAHCRSGTRLCGIPICPNLEQSSSPLCHSL